MKQEDKGRKDGLTNERTEFQRQIEDFIACNQSENASRPKWYCIRYGQKKDRKIKWVKGTESLLNALNSLKENNETDCVVSLAGYADRKQTEENIESIRACIISLTYSEKFYSPNPEEGVKLIQQWCRTQKVSAPNRIIFTNNGYYIIWLFKEPVLNHQLPLWKYIEGFLHRKFEATGSDITATKATVRLRVPYFLNTDTYMPWDSVEEVQVVYRNDEFYESFTEFVINQPLSIEEVKKYLEIKEECDGEPSKARRISKSKKQQDNQPEKSFRVPQREELGAIWYQDLLAYHTLWNVDENHYVFWQKKAVDNTKRRKYWDWVKISELETMIPKITFDRDYWVSAANFYRPCNKQKFVASIQCNFLILRWDKSVLGFIPTPEQGRALVLARCHQIGIPEPEMVDTRDGGLELKWHWLDRMEKDIWSFSNINGYKFNKYWDEMQKKLYYAFWYLGADPHKLHALTMLRVPGTLNTTATERDGIVRIIWKAQGGISFLPSEYMQERLNNLSNNVYGDEGRVRFLLPSEQLARINAKAISQFQDRAEVVEDGRALPQAKVQQSDNQLEPKQKAHHVTKPEVRKPTSKTTQPDQHDRRRIYSQFVHTHAGLIRDWHSDVFAMHVDSDNYVCVCVYDASKEEKNRWSNNWVKVSELKYYLAEFAQTPDFNGKDIYITQLEFFSKKRDKDNVASMRVNFLDLDGKLIGKRHLTPEKWIRMVLRRCRRCKIPYPSIIVFTGNGVHVKWIYDETATRANFDTWNYVQRLLFVQFEDLGADPNSLDGSRVLRLPGTQNFKPETQDRQVRVYELGSADTPKTLSAMLSVLEQMKPINEKLQSCREEWKQHQEQRQATEAEIIRPSQREIVVSDTLKKAEDEWILNTLSHHKPHNTFIGVEISDGQVKFIATYELHKTLREVYETPNMRMCLSELQGQEIAESAEAIAYIPCNYVVLSRCPGETFAEKVANIKRRCAEYNGVGFYAPNQIIRIGEKLLVEWSYSSVVIGKALSIWNPTQELICRYFEDWGAMDEPEHLKATALLPIPGFVYEGGERASLEYYSSEDKYTLNRLSKAVLPFSREEVKKYKEEKAKNVENKAGRKNVASPKPARTAKASGQAKVKKGAKDKGDFTVVAQRRHTAINCLIEMRKDSSGNVPEDTRELCCFYGMVFAKQGGIVTTEDEFTREAERMIKLCGSQFQTECTVKTLYSAWTHDYKVSTETLLEKLHIAADEQKTLKLRVRKVRQLREEYLAEHSQERSKPWEAWETSRATWFRWEARGELHLLKKKCAKKMAMKRLAELLAQKNETGMPYIIARALLRYVVWVCCFEILQRRKCVYCAARFLILMPLVLVYRRRFFRLRLFRKEKLRRGRRRRKRRRG